MPQELSSTAGRAQFRGYQAVSAPRSSALPAPNGPSVRNPHQQSASHHERDVKAMRGKMAAASVSFVVVLALGFAVPAYAGATSGTAPAKQAATYKRELPQQSFTAADRFPAAVVTRDGYGVTVPPPLQWPVSPSTPIGGGFGYRVAPCSGCSSHHEGTDFDVAYGSTVHAMAAGVVVETNDPGWVALGIHLTIQHLIDGRMITSAYGHLQLGSMSLHVGDLVVAGQSIGRVGNTGASTGAHLHFEIRLDGATAVDPVRWMHAQLG